MAEQWWNPFSPAYWEQDADRRRENDLYGQWSPAMRSQRTAESIFSGVPMFFQDLLGKLGKTYDGNGQLANQNPTSLSGKAGGPGWNNQFSPIHQNTSVSGRGADIRPSRSVDDKRDAAMAGRSSVGMQPVTAEDRMMMETDPREDFMNQLLDSLDDPFSFDRGSVNTAFVDEALNAQLANINQARGDANSRFKTSDANIAAMAQAFKNDILGQQGQIRADNAERQKAVTQAFDSTISDAKAREEARRAEDMEMYQRLGIAPAAAQPDIVGKAIESGVQKAESSRNARVAEAASNLETGLDDNRAAANAAVSTGNDQRARLAIRLQDILGALGQREADYRGQAANARMGYVNDMEERAYNRFEGDRDFNRSLYNDYLSMLAEQEAAQSPEGNTSDPQGIIGLNSITDPTVQNEFRAVMEDNPNIAIDDIGALYREFMKRRASGRTDLDQQAFLDYITAYNNLGSTSKFPLQ